MRYIEMLKRLRRCVHVMIYSLKAGQITSKSVFSSYFNTVKQTGDSDDTMELVNIQVLKASNHFNIYAIYNPLTNNPNLLIIINITW